MKQAWLLPLACVLGLGQSGLGQNIDVQKITHGVEQRYNSLKSLQANFTETRIDRGGRRRPVTGVLYLEKPRKMLWEYTSPAGQFYLSDGSYDYLYDPKTKEVERSKVKESDDLRGPLAFLLGKVDFDRDFGSYSTGGADGAITATPKSDKLPFSEMTFVAAAPDFSIKTLSVKGPDGSTTNFTFDGEVANPPLKDSLFKFVLPPGAVVVEGSKQ